MLSEEKYLNLIDQKLQTKMIKSMKYDSVTMTILQSLLNNKPELVNKKYSIFSTDSGLLFYLITE